MRPCLCSDSQSENTLRNSKRISGVVILTFLAAIAVSVGCKGSGSAKSSKEDRAIAAAMTIVDGTLKAPSTADYDTFKVVAKQHPHYAVYMVVDAENSFGAKIRNHFIVVVELLKGDRFKYNKSNAVQTLSRPPDRMVIELAKTLNGWPEPGPAAK